MILLAAAAAVRPARDPALGRLRSVLWLLSTGSLAAAVGLLVTEVTDLGPLAATLVTAGLASAYAGVLWLYDTSPLQHLALFAGVAVVVGCGVGLLDEDRLPWTAGLAVWLLSVLWAVAVRRGYLPPEPAGYLAAALGALVGAQMLMEVAAGHVVALATVAGLLAAGVATGRVWLLGLGGIAAVQIVPQTAARYLPDAVAAPLAVFVTGVALLAVALRLARRRRR